MWYNYSNISVPEIPENTPDFKVDVLTTYFPGEPYGMIKDTLKAITKITYPHTTYLCDEANDPHLKQFCEEHGIIHVTRDNRKNAKAGNINNALEKVATGDICVILDPDHIPEPDFLDPILPHFADPEIGFVQIVQSYYNIKESLVARGAAEQTFQFYGPMMMTLNSYGTVNAIGANCVFRRAALDSIGGHAPGLCEDMHTTMLLYSKGWKAVYVPEVLARGLVPSNLTNFFKQQLKWARGTFDLLVKVYPRVFRSLTARQRIHFAILPMHYFAGVITLINFLIPILALFFTTTPWKGNVIDFALVLLPVAASSLLIRTYIQKWVIEKKERGFHLVGGLLHINTWWIYILGLWYTILDKKIPYLPTPKEDEWSTNLKIIIPNAVVAIISLIAIMYGLSKDFTPFSIVMAGFAFFNALIMLFGIYLTLRITNRNQILRGNLRKKTLSLLGRSKEEFYRLSNFAFTVTRFIAPPLLLFILITSMSFKQQNDLQRWDKVQSSYTVKMANQYLGIFHPSGEGGLSDMEEINDIEAQQNVDFDIISLYLAWNNESIDDFPHDLMSSIYQKNAIPMITWEPWASKLDVQDSLGELKEEKKIFKYITEGYFDDYIIKFADLLKSYDQPVFLRFAHEFDNPQYPWSTAGNNSPEEFKAAWKHVHDLLEIQEAHQVVMVWNPWKPYEMSRYYPGDDFVDWIGLTSLNYGPLNNDGKDQAFEDLYKPFKEKLSSFSRKPVMLAEFGSLNIENTQTQWLENTMDSIKKNHDEISAIVLFNSAFDQNIPANDWYDQKYLDWTTNSIQAIDEAFDHEDLKQELSLKEVEFSQDETHTVTTHEVRGVRYKKGRNWRDSYYALTKEELEKDFNLIKEAGFNTIQFTGGNIYDYNILTYSEKYGLNVIYQFDIDNSIDFVNDHSRLEDLREEIISLVKKSKDKDHIIGYSFNFQLENHFVKPLLLYQRAAYLQWLQSVTTEIKSIDRKRSLILDLELSVETDYYIRKIRDRIPFDSYGLIVNDTTHLDEFLKFSKEENLPVFISAVEPETLLDLEKNLVESNVILENWQDERLSDHITFDGLVDFGGRKKKALEEVERLWNTKKEIKEPSPVKILKPATPLHAGSKYTYRAVVYEDQEWKIASKGTANHKFVWNLVKKDKFGNALAIKELRGGPEIQVKIPEDYEQYELLLVGKLEGRDYVVSSRTNLNIPLKKE